jgi:hypothetical protein
VDRVSFESPASAALSGYSSGSHADAAVVAVAGDHAAVLVVTPDRGGYEYLVICIRHDGGWAEVTSGNAELQWNVVDEEAETGVLAVWGEAPAGASTVAVTVGDERAVVTPRAGYWLVLLEGVHADVSDGWPTVEVVG